jgi:hypothetical protein
VIPTAIEGLSAVLQRPEIPTLDAVTAMSAPRASGEPLSFRRGFALPATFSVC